MFTGIIQHVGPLRRVESTAPGRRLWIDLGPLAEGGRIGDSIAVNGACLTLAVSEGGLGGFDVVAETLGRTTLGAAKVGDRLNLEPALRLGDRLDGHLVQGHVDGVGRVDRIDRGAGQWILHVACDPPVLEQMVPKGSIAVDGVSLTLVDLSAGGFGVSLVPTTLDKTALGARRGGDRVNLETDLIGKYVRRRLDSAGGAGVTLETLRKAGFA